MRSGKRVSAAIGLGGWLIAVALSLLDVPGVVALLMFAAGCGFLIVAGLVVHGQGGAHEYGGGCRSGEGATGPHPHAIASGVPELDAYRSGSAGEIRRSPTPALPKEWVENRLHEMGETWRRKEYRPPRQ